MAAVMAMTDRCLQRSPKEIRCVICTLRRGIDWTGSPWSGAPTNVFNSPGAVRFLSRARAPRRCSRAAMEWFRYVELRRCRMGEAVREGRAENTGAEGHRGAAQAQVLRCLP